MSYLNASDICQHLIESHPARISLVLNFSYFCYNMLRRPQHALNMAKSEYAKASKIIDCLPNELYKDASNHLRNLYDNIILWEKEEIEREECFSVVKRKFEIKSYIRRFQLEDDKKDQEISFCEKFKDSITNRRRECVSKAATI